MATNLNALYNLSIDGKSPLFEYLPRRAAGANGALAAWTLPNSEVNASYTTNAAGANVELQWTGTAIWLYGTVNASSNYDLIRSWSDVVLAGNTTDKTGGVLFSESGLAYGSYTLALTVGEGPVTITGATISVGMGDAGSSLQSYNQSAVSGAGSGETNPFFRTSPGSSWASQILDGAQTVLRTDAEGDAVSFTVQSSVGFALYGTTALEYGAYNVSVDPAPGSAAATAALNASTAFEVLGALKFLATGLDAATAYTVTVTNAQNRACDVGEVVLHRAVLPVPASTSSAGSASAPTLTLCPGSVALPGSSRLSVGDIIGITIGAACLASLVLFGIGLCVQRCWASDFVADKTGRARSRRCRYLRAPRCLSGAFLIDEDYEPEPRWDLRVTPLVVDASARPGPTAESSPAAEGSSPVRDPAVSASGHLTLAAAQPASAPEQDAGPLPGTTPPSYDPAWTPLHPTRSTRRALKPHAPALRRLVLQGEPTV